MKKLGIIGLGNPGYEYSKTRHNVGFMVVDYLHEKFSFTPWKRKEVNFISSGKIDDTEVYLVKPQTYMNLSGIGVRDFIDKYKITPKEILVIQDDLDLATGIIRIKFNGKDGGHNGIKSIIKEINTSEFYRLRIGIGRPKNKEEVIEFVLSNFEPEEFSIIEKTIKLIPQIIETIIKEGWEKAQNLYNRKCLPF